MVDNETELRQRIEAIETVDVVPEDLIEGLGAFVVGNEVVPRRVFVLIGEGGNVFAELIGRDEAREGIIRVDPDAFVNQNTGELRDRLQKTIYTEDGPIEFDAEINLA